MKKNCFLLTVLLVIATFLNAQQPSSRPKVGLVLSGGGAKGAAHIGIIKYLEEIGIPVDYIAGTSMGSIVGGFYALGYNAAELDTIISSVDWNIYMSNAIKRDKLSSKGKDTQSSYLITIPFNVNGEEIQPLHRDKPSSKENLSFISSLPSSIIDGTRIINLINSYCVGYQDSISFNDLVIPFACVGTDIKSGKEIILNSGRLPLAIRASMAIPGVFAPVRIDGHILVDGGMLNNFPADICKDMGADILIGIDVSDGIAEDEEDLQSLPQLLNQLVNITIAGKLDHNKELCDIYIHPDITGYGTLSFEKSSIDTLIQRGYHAAELNKDKFLALKETLDAYGPVTYEHKRPKAVSIQKDMITLNSVNFTNTTDKEKGWLIRKGHLQEGSSIKAEDIDKAIDIFEGTGAYSKITYSLTEAKTSTDSIRAFDLNIRLKKTAPHSAGFGFRYDTEESAAVLFNIGFNQNRLDGLKVDFTSKLSYNPYLGATITWAQQGLADFNLSYEYRSSEFKTFRQTDIFDIVRARSNRISLYVSEFHLRNYKAALGMRYEFLPLIQLPSAEETAKGQYYGPFCKFTFDNMDDAFFARHGSKAALSANLRSDVDTKQLWGDISLNYSAYLTPKDSKLTFEPQVYLRACIAKETPFIYRNFAGGSMEGRYLEQQMPFIGILNTIGIDNYATIARLDARYNIFGKHYISGIVNYMHHSESLGEFFNSGKSHSNWGAGLRYTLDSPIGPISLDGQWSDISNSFCVYFNLGYTF